MEKLKGKGKEYLIDQEKRECKVEGKWIKIFSKLREIKVNRIKTFWLHGAIKFFNKINYLF